MKLVVYLRFYSKIKDSLETLPPEKTEIEVVLKKLCKMFKTGACLPRARPFSFSPTTSKRLLRRLTS